MIGAKIFPADIVTHNDEDVLAVARWAAFVPATAIAREVSPVVALAQLLRTNSADAAASDVPLSSKSRRLRILALFGVTLTALRVFIHFVFGHNSPVQLIYRDTSSLSRRRFSRCT